MFQTKTIHQWFEQPNNDKKYSKQTKYYKMLIRNWILQCILYWQHSFTVWRDLSSEAAAGVNFVR